MADKEKFVFMFNEGDGSQRNLLGGKGANLAQMVKLGIPVPSGFTISTDACVDYYNSKLEVRPEILKEVETSLKKLEKTTGKTFGGGKKPLLVSVRSGARISMPGMMDTILNLGINDEVVKTLASTMNEWTAYDNYRRFIQMYSDVVRGLNKSKFEVFIDEIKKRENIKLDSELSVENLKELIGTYKKFYFEQLGEEFPQDPHIQLNNAIKGVFGSWDNERAKVYRKMNDIPSNWGTAVNIQEMVFGNLNNKSGTGVAFTRNPSTGENKIYGEYLMNAQGEDIVAGVRTPKLISELAKENKKAYEEFVDICKILESYFKDMQDMEFTIEDGKLFMLQTRNGKRTAQASLRVAVDMVKEGKITEEEALLKMNPKQLDALLHPAFNPEILKNYTPISKGLPASPGSACGFVALSPEIAKKLVESGRPAVLVRQETSPEDIMGMNVSEGVLTARGGMTSHAAVVARGLGTCCVAGCSDLIVNLAKGYCEINGRKFTEKDYISLDGTTGNVYADKIEESEAVLSDDFKTVMKWANKYKRMEVRANADTVRDAETALKFGATGIGLVRTEHMFFKPERILAVREMIIANTKEDRISALNKLEQMQETDFYNILKVMKGLPVTVRLLDPPLHEFLPKTEKDIKKLSKETGKSVKFIKERIEELKEFNPMMGHRGCRLGVTYPEITEMQTTALVKACLRLEEEKTKVKPEIMIPLTVSVKEYLFLKEIIQNTINKLSENSKVKYLIGSMIETPRASVIAGDLAHSAEFYSFGTNDLTQLTFGFSRDDAGKFLPDYYKNKVFDFDPFATVDTEGVGELVKNAVSQAKSVNPKIECGVCGEHGGDPRSVEFFNSVGLDYVSCSPYRVAISILAAAQANIKNKQ